MYRGCIDSDTILLSFYCPVGCCDQTETLWVYIYMNGFTYFIISSLFWPILLQWGHNHNVFNPRYNFLCRSLILGFVYRLSYSSLFHFCNALKYNKTKQKLKIYNGNVLSWYYSTTFSSRYDHNTTWAVEHRVNLNFLLIAHVTQGQHIYTTINGFTF